MGKIGVCIGYGLAVVVSAILVLAAFKITDDEKGQWLNLLFVFAGGLAGWTAGILVTPRPDEQAKFNKLGLAITALVGGSIGTKAIEALGKEIDGDIDASFVGSSVLLLSAFLLGGLLTFIWRSYKG